MRKEAVCPWCEESFQYEVRPGTRPVYCCQEHSWKAGAVRQKARNAELQERRCALCGEIKPHGDFGSNTTVYCRPCHTAYERKRQQARKKQDPAYTRMLNLRRYGLTPEAFDAMLAAQDGRCAICRTGDPGPSGWQVDHDHTCCNTRKRSCGRCTRGILCTRCNIGLGNFQDNLVLLRAAITYVSDYRRARAGPASSSAGGGCC